MKYIFSILLAVFLTGCTYTGGNTAKNIRAGVKKCTAAFCLSKKVTVPAPTAIEEETGTITVVSVSLIERSSEILTW